MTIQRKRTLASVLAICMIFAASAPQATFAWSELEARGGEEPQDHPKPDKPHHDDQDQDSDQGQGEHPDKPQGDKPDDNGQGHDDDQGQNGDDGQDQDGDQGQDGGKHKAKYFRVDCRYHNDEGIDGIGHCYASSIYSVKHDKFKSVRLGVGCDSSTIYNDRGRIHEEELGERISPPTAAFPAVEISPKGALTNPGTYESVLDIREGRLEGRCYVQDTDDKRFLPFE